MNNNWSARIISETNYQTACKSHKPATRHFYFIISLAIDNIFLFSQHTEKPLSQFLRSQSIVMPDPHSSSAMRGAIMPAMLEDCGSGISSRG